jgi:hypothetical protein
MWMHGYTTGTDRRWFRARFPENDKPNRPKRNEYQKIKKEKNKKNEPEA